MQMCVLVKLFLFIIFLLRFAYGGVFLMTAFLKIYPIRKIRNIPIYRLAYSIAMYRNISYRNPCIVIRIVSPDSCQYTALVSVELLIVFSLLRRVHLQHSVHNAIRLGEQQLPQQCRYVRVSDPTLDTLHTLPLCRNNNAYGACGVYVAFVKSLKADWRLRGMVITCVGGHGGCVWRPSPVLLVWCQWRICSEADCRPNDLAVSHSAF